MRNAKLTILASLSLVTLAVLAWGYVGTLGLGIGYVSMTPSDKTLRAVWADAFGGQFMVAWESETMPGRALWPALSPGLHIFPHHRFKTSLARDWPWDFHRNTQMGGTTYLYCPLWFAALPFTIAPIVWLRRRRRRRTRGFPVEGSEPLSERVEMQTDRQTPTGV